MVCVVYGDIYLLSDFARKQFIVIRNAIRIIQGEKNLWKKNFSISSNTQNATKSVLKKPMWWLLGQITTKIVRKVKFQRKKRQLTKCLNIFCFDKQNVWSQNISQLFQPICLGDLQKAHEKIKIIWDGLGEIRNQRLENEKQIFQNLLNNLDKISLCSRNTFQNFISPKCSAHSGLSKSSEIQSIFGAKMSKSRWKLKKVDFFHMVSTKKPMKPKLLRIFFSANVWGDACENPLKELKWYLW